ncbi:MAG: hypothetical protein LBO04_05280 [Spirochaetaceae bacterium]|jgi:hypothetical protein|nr:hypothetical protein [Spirochaetaceae bacterium]
MQGFETIRRKLDHYKRIHPSLRGFILDFPKEFEERAKQNFYKQVGGMISSFGAVVRLPSRRVLVLLPKKYDCALVAHRLCGNLESAALLFFESNNTDIIVNLIRDY